MKNKFKEIFKKKDKYILMQWKDDKAKVEIEDVNEVEILAFVGGVLQELKKDNVLCDSHLYALIRAILDTNREVEEEIKEVYRNGK